MSKPDSTHENLFSYGQMRATYASDSPAARYELHIPQFVRNELLPILRSALQADVDILTTTPNTTLQNFLSPWSRQCLWELHSGIMLRLLENITGAKNLLPDTHCKQSCLLTLGDALATNTVSDDTNTGLHASLALMLLLDSGDAIIRNLSVPTSTGHTSGRHSDSTDKKNVLKIVYWTHQVADA